MKPYYESGDIQIFCGDYRDVIPGIKRSHVGLLLTDPPYGTTQLEWDDPIDWPSFWVEAHRVCRLSAPMVLFSAGHFTNHLINSNRKFYRYELIWEKTMAVGFLDANRRPLRAHENINVFIRKYKGSVYHPQMIVGRMHKRGQAGSNARHYNTARKTPGTVTSKFYPRSVLHFNNARGSRSLHPTQKPLDLIEWLIRTYSNRMGLVFDPFLGSGTTLVAAQKLRRRAIGVEREEKYCEIAARRLMSGEAEEK